MKYLYTLILGALAVIGIAFYATYDKPVDCAATPDACGSVSFGSQNSGLGKMTCTNTSVVVSSTTSTAILAQKGSRTYARITNDGAAPVYFSRGGTAATSTGGTIPANSFLEFEDDVHPYWGSVTGIASSTSNTVKVIDCTANTYN